mmetsp:Transcript_65324/g.187938  ORF Transcript_65324/g.187938 Transcript_65324/m.187938 type:complete len:205 (-) Transcript_65324:980-1594(-)
MMKRHIARRLDLQPLPLAIDRHKALLDHGVQRSGHGHHPIQRGQFEALGDIPSVCLCNALARNFLQIAQVPAAQAHEVGNLISDDDGMHRCSQLKHEASVPIGWQTIALILPHLPKHLGKRSLASIRELPICCRQLVGCHSPRSVTPIQRHQAAVQLLVYTHPVGPIQGFRMTLAVVEELVKRHRNDIPSADIQNEASTFLYIG